jgi:hypothetical protein
VKASKRAMAKKKGPEDKAPSFPATPAYKQWVWEEIRRRKWTQQKLIDEMKKADRSLTKGALTETITTGWLTQFLGPEDAERRYHTNSELLPAINKALEIAPPPVCDPSSQLAQVRDLFVSVWGKLTPLEQQMILMMLRKANEPQSA